MDLAAFDAGGGSALVPIVVDCRDCAFDCPQGDCFGCAGLGRGGCPTTFPQSFCVPGVQFVCNKVCQSDADCFEGARTCLPDGACDTRARTGALCSPCALVDGVPLGCDTGFTCVGPPGASQGFCAPSCPDNRCVAGTRCNRVGNNLGVVGAQ